MNWDDFVLWISSLVAGLALAGARLGWLLFKASPFPPSEPEALVLWKLKRKWLIISELSALPCFTIVAVSLGKMQHWSIEGIVLLSMGLGGLGFAFLLDALQTIARKKLNM